MAVRRLARPITFRLCLVTLLAGLLLPTPQPAPAFATPPVPPENAWATWQCWDPRNADPCHDDLFSVAVLSPTDAWAAGGRHYPARAVMLHWDGLAWMSVSLPPGAGMISALSFAAPDDGWALGEYGSAGTAFYHWDGVAWTEAFTHSAYLRRSIDMVSPTDGWAAGYQAIARWDGANWSVITTTYDLDGLDMLSPADGWAVGAENPYGNAVILHWDGTTWNPTTTPYRLQAVDMLSPTDGWAVGYGYESIFHWDGLAWTPVTAPSGLGLWSVSMVSAAEGWAVGHDFVSGEGVVLHWDGSAWARAPSPSQGGLFAVAVASPSDAWAVGDQGALAHWNGLQWTDVTGRRIDYFPEAVDMISATDGWAVGDRLIKHWDGSQWTDAPDATRFALWAVDMLSTNDGWAVGSLVDLSGTDWAASLRWDGQHWTEVPVPAPAGTALVGVSVVSPADAWAISDNHVFHWDGTQWTGTLIGIGFAGDVDMRSSVDGWAVGGNWTGSVVIPATYHWDGNTWAEVSVPGELNELYDVAVLPNGEAWAVGANLILHWDGSLWSSVAYTPTVILLALAMVSPTDGWAVGDYATVLHWDGTTWTQVPTPYGEYGSPYDVSMAGPDDGWIVGYPSTFLRYTSALRVVSGADAVDATPGDGACETAAGNGQCTLRAAIQEANARGGEQIIVLPPGRYPLTIPGRDEDDAATGDLDIRTDLRLIAADPARTIVDGGGLDRVFDIIGAYTVTLSGFTLHNGDAGNSRGGALRNAGTLTLSSALLSGNSAMTGGGFANTGTATLEYVTLHDNEAGYAGGGLDSTGVLTLTHSSMLSNTSAVLGGGLSVAGGTTRALDSTFSDNAALDGGGVSAGDGVLALVNSTLSGNHATHSGGGLAAINELVALYNVTLVANTAGNSGGGAFVPPAASLTGRDSILAGNTDAGAAPDCWGTFISQGYNLVQNTTGCTVAGDPTGNQLGVDPLLGPLQNNGGPTLTHNLLTGSPAIDAGDPAGCVDDLGALLNYDQRGYPRPTGLHCEPGAVEFIDFAYRLLLPIAANQPVTR